MYYLSLDCEAAGQNVLKHPVVSLGVALIEENAMVANHNGKLALREYFIPPKPGQTICTRTFTEFWNRPCNTDQFNQWNKFCSIGLSRDEVVKEFICYVEDLCEGKKVKQIVDTAGFDVSRIDALLADTADWEGKPDSWAYIQRHPRTNKRVYSPILDVSSYYEGQLYFLQEGELEKAKLEKGGLKKALRYYYQIPDPIFLYNSDHWSSHDAARMGLDYTWIKWHLKSRYV
jgi:hypothetical protein